MQRECPYSYANRVRVQGDWEKERGEEERGNEEQPEEREEEEMVIEETPEEERGQQPIVDAVLELSEEEVEGEGKKEEQKGEEEGGSEALKHLRGLVEQLGDVGKAEGGSWAEEMEAREQGQEGGLKKRKKQGGEKGGKKRVGLETEVVKCGGKGKEEGGRGKETEGERGKSRNRGKGGRGGSAEPWGDGRFHGIYGAMETRDRFPRGRVGE